MDFLSKLRARFHYGNQLHPVRDWLALLSLFAILFAGILVWNIWAFSTVASGGIIGGAMPPAPQVFKQSSLDTIHQVFTDRAAEEMKYTSGVYRFTDPSQ